MNVDIAIVGGGLVGGCMARALGHNGLSVALIEPRSPRPLPAAGFDLRVSIEAVVGFVNRTSGASVTRVTTPARLLPGKREYELTSNDRRFLRSLRISCDESKKETVE